MKKCLIRNDFSGFEFCDLLGENLLSGIKPVIVDFNGNTVERLEYCGLPNKECYSVITDKYNKSSSYGHIDIFSEQCTLIYDMGENKDIDAVFISGFFDCNTDYTLAEYKLFLSENIDNLFSIENEIVYYNNSGCYRKSKTRNSAEQYYEISGFCGRYFAVKIIKSNPTDDITRISNIALYNHKYSNSVQFCKKNFEQNILFGKTPTVKGTYAADLSILTDGICFDEKRRMVFDCDTELTFRLAEPTTVNEIGIVGSLSALDNCEIFLCDDKDKLFSEDSIVEVERRDIVTNENGVFCAKFDTHSDCFSAYIGLKFLCGDFVDQLSVLSIDRNITVEQNNVLNDDFVGFGVNCLPMALMPESINAGYNDAFWEFERARIITTRPAVVRLWFQPDWFIIGEEEYARGEYNFNTLKMQSVYRYLDAFRAAGTEVELNYGWKCCTEFASWFNVNFEGNKITCAAPKDLTLFAKSCASLIKELVEVRGYDNIKYLSFYNEPNYGISNDGDFNLPSNKPKEYYAELYKTVINELKSQNLLQYIEPWACEHSGSDAIQWEWTDFTAKNLSEYAEKITHHRYSYTYGELMKFFAKHKSLCSGLPLILSEYGVRYDIYDKEWELNHVSYSMAIHNSGYSGALLWTMSGISITDPCSFLMINPMDLWSFIPYNDGKDINRVNTSFYETSLQMRYIKNHSSSLYVNAPYKDIHTAAWVKGDDISVLVSAKYGTEKNLHIDLGKFYGKKIYRHIYKDSVEHNGNATVIPVDKIFEATDVINDTVDADYQAAMYTTVPPITQISFDSVYKEISAGETAVFKADIIDGEPSAKLIWSLGASTTENKGSVDMNGVYTASEKAKTGDYISVIATVSGTERSAVVIVKIK